MTRPLPDRLFVPVLAVQALCVVLVLIAVIMARSFPVAAERLAVRVIADRPWLASAAGGLRRAVTGAAERGREGFDYRVRGPVSRLLGVTRGPARSLEETASGFPAETCRGCHETFDTRPLHATVYFRHSRHERVEDGCPRCHEGDGPGRDSSPSMSGCADCHQAEVEGGGEQDCEFCHPPGSVFHGARLAGDREIGKRCDVCHNEAKLHSKARLHDMPRFATEPSSCTACHDGRFCDRCHPATHAPAYIAAHPGELERHERAQTDCWDCHDSRWCAMRCHAAMRDGR